MEKKLFRFDRYGNGGRMIFVDGGEIAAAELSKFLSEKGFDVKPRWFCSDKEIPQLSRMYDNFIGILGNGVVVVTGPMTISYRDSLEDFTVEWTDMNA